MGFGGLYVSISGLQANKTSLNTVSHNISNVNNPNYVRQSTIQATNYYIKSPDNKYQLGTGVNIQEIRQIRDEFLDIKYRNEVASYGYHKAKSAILEDVEGIFNEITDSGLQKVMDDFWDNWNELYKEADSLTIRGLVHESSVAFTDTLNHISMQLDNMTQNLNREIVVKVGQVNDILKNIAELNKGIKLVEGSNSRIKANDYRDERNALIDKLSELVPLSYHENKYGEAIISIQGKELISGEYINEIQIKNNPSGIAEIYWKNSNEKIDLNGLGELGGLIDVRDKSIDEYKGRLDQFVNTIATEINNIHRTGYDLGGNTGIDFFVPGDGSINAANIRVNPDLYDFNKIAVSSKDDARGDGEIAKSIYLLRKTEIFTVSGNGMNTDEYYRDIVLSLGIERETSRSVVANQGFLIQKIDEKRKEISAVSLDEEMADMIKYQHSYVANSRVINAIDEMIENIVNRMGVVGR